MVKAAAHVCESYGPVVVLIVDCVINLLPDKITENSPGAVICGWSPAVPAPLP